MDPKSPVRRKTDHTSMLGETILGLPLVYRRHQNFIKERYGISLLELEILQEVCLHGNRRMKDISETFKVRLSTLTSLIDKLENRGLVQRVKGTEDRREVLVEKTERSREICMAFFLRFNALAHLLTRRYDHVKVEALSQGIGHLRSMI